MEPMLLFIFSYLLANDAEHDFERAADAKKQEEIKNLLTDVKSHLGSASDAKKQEQAQHPHSGVLNPEDPSQIALPKKLSLDSVEAFREVMRKDEPALQILREKGINTQQVENIADYCKNFADGVEYAAKKYGTKPSAIFIEQNKEPSLDVNPENGSITITTGFLHNVSQQTYIDEPKTRPYALKRDDSAFLRG
ncbi:MAG: hypothetical protein EAY65_06270 [Alphaproteobacteria bacterium]|nr:MAG: hypothetical protein EAY65_06270 [Alphaproteobacteria bacterium]